MHGRFPPHEYYRHQNLSQALELVQTQAQVLQLVPVQTQVLALQPVPVQTQALALQLASVQTQVQVLKQAPVLHLATSLSSRLFY